MNARKATTPPRFEVKAPAKASNVVVVYLPKFRPPIANDN
jgi:hypothetical protein